MVKTITFPYILTVVLTYFLATVIISAIKEETVISLVLQQLSIEKVATDDKFQVIWNMSQSFQKVIFFIFDL